MIQEFRCYVYEYRGRWVCGLDFRTRDGVPFLHRGNWFDSFEHATEHAP